MRRRPSGCAGKSPPSAAPSSSSIAARTPEERLRLERLTQRLQGLPETRDALFAVGAKLLQRHAEALLAGLAKVVAVAGVEMTENIGDDEARNAWYLHDVGPAVEKARRRPP